MSWIDTRSTRGGQVDKLSKLSAAELTQWPRLPTKRQNCSLTACEYADVGSSFKPVAHFRFIADSSRGHTHLPFMKDPSSVVISPILKDAVSRSGACTAHFVRRLICEPEQDTPQYNAASHPVVMVSHPVARSKHTGFNTPAATAKPLLEHTWIALPRMGQSHNHSCPTTPMG